MAPTTVPCAYKTGRTLGSGTYATVKECIKIETGEYFACKVINKKLMEGREHMVRNEIAVLKRVSEGHPHILSLYDFFETQNNLYLVMELCTGGELFDRICSKGSYYERDARHIVYTITNAVSYLHDNGIVHRDLKPENVIFKSPKEDADLVIADFGLSRMMDDDKFNLLTTTCGTPGYMAPEVFKKSGHGKPVDIWAIGVITYFLCAGYTPFDRDSNLEEIQAICSADYAFEPKEYWRAVSDVAKDFIRKCLVVDKNSRMTAKEALAHPWLASEVPHAATDDAGKPKDLLPNLRRNFDAKKTWRKAVISVQWINAAKEQVEKNKHLSEDEKHLLQQVKEGQQEAEKEEVNTV